MFKGNSMEGMSVQQSIKQAQLQALQKNSGQGTPLYSGVGGGWPMQNGGFAFAGDQMEGFPVNSYGCGGSGGTWPMQRGYGGCDFGNKAAGGGKGCDGSAKGGFGKGKSKGKGKNFKGFKGSSKGKRDGDFGSYGGDAQPWNLGADADAMADARRQIEVAQRKAQFRDKSAISQAQKTAQQRFERDILERVKGYWVDENDRKTTYHVEGNLCSVTSNDNNRIFRNRLSVFGGALCWDARIFWHTLKMDLLPPPEEEVKRCEWIPGEGSQSSAPIVWLRTDPPEVPENFKAPDPSETPLGGEEKEGSATAASED